ncbi:MAG: phosphate acyltransferase, partial [Vampirovibrionia bacterium]
LNTYKELKKDAHGVNFVGNIEGRDVFLGECDVVICDGFTGNVTLKVAEGVAKMLVGILRTELSHGSRNKLGAVLAKPAFARLKKRIDYEEYGGSLLLGVNGICVIAHGGSNDSAIKNAIRVAMESVQHDVTSKIVGLCEVTKV